MSFKPAFSLSSYNHIKRLFSSSSLSAIRVVLSSYLRLLIFLPAIWNPACDSSSPAFHMMYSPYKVKKQGDDMRPYSTPFHFDPVHCSMSSSTCYFLTHIEVSQETVRWSGSLSSLRIFHSLLWSKDFSTVNEAEVDVFLEFPCFLYDLTNVGQLISGSSAFSKPRMYIWKSLVHVLLKSSLKDFEYYPSSMWNDCNCRVVWTFLYS